ncbi:PDDEXK nuclease domain-containing protein [Sorangium sp. So ce281]|uniref:PDDEXK nuclease domain-containing protein n=1 Tax=unclassified Sorangium TaxID=2621164 RepID=UPI003F617CF1
MKTPPAPSVAPSKLVGDISRLIEAARQRAAVTVNAVLTRLYWRIGARIRTEVLRYARAAYGDRVIAALAEQLQRRYGRGFSEKTLRRMVQFAEAFPEESIVATLSRQLTWSHFVLLLPLEAPLARAFYAEMCRVERWSVRALHQQIDSMLYERTALSRKPKRVVEAQIAALRAEDQVTPEMLLKDPYVLDFLGVQDRYLEKDLEDAILRELEAFILELGSGFCFVARQKRIQIDGDDFYIDLVFYNRKLQRIVAVDLKVGAFKAEYKGQMELYLRWLDRHEREPGEETPLGIILCAGKRREQIELLELGKTGIHVAEYLTVLPPRDELARRLHAAMEHSRARLAPPEEAR